MTGERRPWWVYGCSGDLTERDLRNLWRVNVRLFLLVGAFGVALFALGADSVTSPWAAWLVLLPLVFGLWLLRAGYRFLAEADELTRRIQVEGMAAGFGAGLVASLLERPMHEASELLGNPWWLHEAAELTMPFMWMGIVYAITVVRLQRRYCA